MGLKPHEDRVVAEENALSAKLSALTAFIRSDAFQTLSDEDKQLLEEQEDHMLAYADVLQRRIDRFKEAM